MQPNRISPGVFLRGLLLVSLASATFTHAQTTNNWTSATNGFWTVASNWSPGVPVSSTNTILQFNASGGMNFRSTNNNNGNYLVNQLLLNSTSTNTISLSGGALQFSLGTAGGPQLLQQNSGAVNISNAVLLATNLTFGGTGTGAVNIAGVISGTNSVLKTGNYKLTLTGANTFGGAGNVVDIEGGTLAVSATAGLGNATNVVIIGNDATLQFNGSFTQSRPLIMGAGGGHLEVTSNFVTVVNVPLGTNGNALTKDGSGILQLQANNILRSGTTAINGGLLQVDNSAVLGSNGVATTINLNGGTFGYNSGTTLTNTINFAGGTLAPVGGNRNFEGVMNFLSPNTSTISLADARTTNFSRAVLLGGVLTGDGNVSVIAGTNRATLTLTNNLNTFSGLLSVGTNAQLVSSHTNGSTLGTATIELNAGSLLRILHNGFTSTTVTNRTNAVVQFSNNIVVNGNSQIEAFRVNANGNAATNYSAFRGLTINSSTVTFSNFNDYGFRFESTSAVSGSATIDFATTLRPVPIIFNGPITDGTNAGTLNKTGSGSLFFTNFVDNTFSGGLNIVTGLVAATAGFNTNTSNFITTPLGIGPVTLASGILQLRSDTNITIGPGGGNNLTITSNAFINVDRVTAAGGTAKTISLGALTLPSNNVVVAGGNAFVLRFTGPTTLNGNARLTASNDVILNGPISESISNSSFTKLGTARLFITNQFNNTYSGGTYIGLGVVRVTGGTNTNNATFVTTPLGTGDVTISNATLELRSDTNQIFGVGNGYGITGIGPTTINVDRPGASGVNNTFQIGSLELPKGTNTFTLTSGNGMFLGVQAPFTVSNNIFVGGGNIQLNDTATFIGSNTLAATFRFQSNVVLQGDQLINAAGNVVFNGQLTEAAPGTQLAKIGTGTLFLTNLVNNNYSGGSFITNGGFQIAANGATNTPAGTNNIWLDNATLLLRSLSNQVFGPGNGYVVIATNNTGINVDRYGGANANGLVQISQLNHDGGTLTVAGGNTFNLRVDGSTIIKGIAGFNVTDTRSANPFSVLLAGPISEGTAGSVLRKLGTENLGYTNLIAPSHTGGTVIENGVVVWRPANAPAGGYAFGSGPIRIDGGGGSTFAFQQNASNNYVLSNNFIISGSVQNGAGFLFNGGGTLDFTAQGTGLPLVTNTGSLTLRGPLTITAGSSGFYNATTLAPATFVGPAMVAGNNQIVLVNGSGGGTGSRIVINSDFGSDGAARNLTLIANNGTGLELGGNNSGFSGNFKVATSVVGTPGRVIFANTNALPGGIVEVGNGALASLASGFSNANLVSVLGKFSFAPNSVLALAFNLTNNLDLSPTGANRDVRLGAPDGFNVTHTGLITPYASTYKFGGGSNAVSLNAANLLRDGLTNSRSLDVNVNPFASPLASVPPAGSVVIGGSNSYTGGTVINSGALTISTGRANTPLGTGSVDIYGLLQANGNGSFADASGNGNNNLFVTHPGGEIRLDSTGTLNTNRLGDTAPLTLNGAILSHLGRAAAIQSAEKIGALNAALGSQLTLSSSSTAGATSLLTLDSLNRIGAGTLQLNRGTGLLGSTNARLLVTVPLATNNGMTAPWIINATDVTFANYSPATGITNVVYSANPLTAAGANDVIATPVTASSIALAADTAVYALRSGAPIVGGASSNLTIRSGGLLFNSSVTHSNLNLIFGDTGTNEALIYVQNGLTARLTNTTINAGSITKFGEGQLRLDSSLNTYSNGWNINRGSVALGNFATNGLGVTAPGNVVNLNGRVTLQFSGISNAMNYGGGKLVNQDINTITTDFGAQSDRTQTYASGIDLNSISNGPLGSVLLVRQSGSRNIFSIQGPATLNADSLVNVQNLTFPITGGSNRFAFGGLVGNGRTLSKFGNGTLVLSNDSSTTFSGGTIDVAGGVLAVAHNGALGDASSKAIITANNVFELVGGVTNFSPIAQLTQQPGSAERWQNEFNRFANTTNAQTYIVPTNVNLQLAANLNLTGPATNSLNKTIQLNGGTIEAYNYIDDARTAVITVGTNVTLQLAANSKVGQSGVDIGRNGVIFSNNATITEIGGARSLTKVGLDTVVLGGKLNYTGGTFVNEGILRISRNDTLPIASRLAITNFATFDLNGFNQSVASLWSDGNVVNGSTNLATLRLNNTDASYITSAVTGRVNIIKFNSGSLTLSGLSTFTGGLQANGGDVFVTADTVGRASPLGDSGNLVVIAGPSRLLTTGSYRMSQPIVIEDPIYGGPKVIGTVANNSTNTFSGNISLLDNVTLTAPANARVNFTGNIAQSSSTPYGVTKEGPGTVSLTGANAFTGDVLVSEGTLLVNNTVGSGTGAIGNVFVENGATLGGSGRMSNTVWVINGALRPGNPVGALRIDSDLQMLSQATLAFELGGLIATNDYDVLSIGGTAVFDGTLELSLTNSFLPPTNKVFTLVQYALNGGSFFLNAPSTGFRLTTADTLGSFRVSYGANTLTADAFRYTDTDTDGIYDAWALKYFGVRSLANGTNATDRFGDFDGDGMNNYHEFIAGTVPTDSSSAFKVTTTSVAGNSNLTVRFTTASEVGYRTQIYQIQYTADFVTWTTVANPTLTFPQAGVAEWVDNGSQTGGTPPLQLASSRFYRVIVK